MQRLHRRLVELGRTAERRRRLAHLAEHQLLKAHLGRVHRGRRVGRRRALRERERLLQQRVVVARQPREGHGARVEERRAARLAGVQRRHKPPQQPRRAVDVAAVTQRVAGLQPQRRDGAAVQRQRAPHRLEPLLPVPRAHEQARLLAQRRGEPGEGDDGTRQLLERRTALPAPLEDARAPEQHVRVVLRRHAAAAAAAPAQLLERGVELLHEAAAAPAAALGGRAQVRPAARGLGALLQRRLLRVVSAAARQQSALEQADALVQLAAVEEELRG